MRLHKNKNFSLFTGLALILLLLLVSLFPGLFTVSDPYATQTVITDSTGTVRAAPFAPGVYGILGSDELGRDLYAQVIYGTRLTLKTVLFSVLFTLLLAFLPGLVAGFGRNFCRWLLKVLNITFSTIPAIVFCMIMIRFPFITSLPVEKALIAFALIIAIVEAGRMGSFIQQRVEEIMKEPFIEGAVVVGKSPVQIAFQNVVPHLLPGLIVFLSLEAARVLFLMCQLAVFNVVAGNINYDAEVSGMMGRFLPYEPEWSALLGTSIRRILTHTWIVIPPLAAFFISILSFNLLGEGLRIEFEKKNSHFITFVRKGIYLLSPKAFVYDICSTRRHPMRGLVKLGVVVALVTAFTFPRYLFYNDFDARKVCDTIGQIKSGQVSHQNSFKDNRDQFAAYISEKLAASGLAPAGNDGYYYSFEGQDISYFASRKITISLDGDKKEILKKDRDYKVITPISFSFDGKLSDDLYSSKDKIYIVNEDSRSYNELVQLLPSLENDKLCKAIFVIKPDTMANKVLRSGIDLLNPFSAGFTNQSIPVIEINQKTGEKLLNNMDATVSIALEANLRNFIDGKNLYAAIPGTDSKMDDQYIVIGTGYDYSDFDSKHGADRGLQEISTVAVNLELARAIAEKGAPKRTIIFAFWDFHGKAYNGALNIKKAKGITSIWDSLYIDLKGLYPAGDDKVLIDLSSNSPGMLDNQRIIKYLQNEFIHMGISVKNEKVGSAEAAAALYNSFGSIIIEAPGTEQQKAHLNSTGTEIDRVKIKKLGQALYNAITQAAY